MTTGPSGCAAALVVVPAPAACPRSFARSAGLQPRPTVLERTSDTGGPNPVALSKEGHSAARFADDPSNQPAQSTSTTTIGRKPRCARTNAANARTYSRTRGKAGSSPEGAGSDRATTRPTRSAARGAMRGCRTARGGQKARRAAARLRASGLRASGKLGLRLIASGH